MVLLKIGLGVLGTNWRILDMHELGLFKVKVVFILFSSMCQYSVAC